MNKNKIFSVMITIFLLSVLMIPNVKGSSYTWIYEENLNDFKNFGGYGVRVELYNSFTLTKTGVETVNSVGLYLFNNPSNDTFIDNLKIGIYTNYNNSPNVLISQSYETPILKSGWLDLELQTPLILTGGVNYWYGAIVEGDTCICSIVYYTNVTNTLMFSKGQLNNVWDTLFNPAEPTTTVNNTRLGAFRIGYMTEEIPEYTSFIDIFEHPETYLSGLIVIFLFGLILYFIFKRR